MEKSKRNYRKEYDNYHASPEQRQRNAARLRARRLMVKKGKVKVFDKKDVHHKDNDPTNNDLSNLSVTTQKYNRTEPRLRDEERENEEAPVNSTGPAVAGTSGDPSEINSILKINLLGVTNSVIPFIPKMKEQHSGRIAIISSIASFRGLPHHGGYSASKAALRNLTESWNYTLKPYGISLTTIFPGYIDTEMTKDHKFKMPFLMHSDKASRIIANSIQQKKRKLILPWQWKFIIPIFCILPQFLIYRFTPNQIKLK